LCPQNATSNRSSDALRTQGLREFSAQVTHDVAVAEYSLAQSRRGRYAHLRKTFSIRECSYMNLLSYLKGCQLYKLEL